MQNAFQNDKYSLLFIIITKKIMIDTETFTSSQQFLKIGLAKSAGHF
jgi:hypothetical protein